MMADYIGCTLSDVFKRVQESLRKRSIYKSWPNEEREAQTRFEAETLLLYATGMSRTRLLISLADRSLTNHISDEAALVLQNAVSLRLQSMPLGYIVKKVNFYGRDFTVGPGCLIPRPETEVLVEEAIQWTLQNNPNSHIYDLGCGSGAISVSLALECQDARVSAVDISEDALQIAKSNANALGAKVAFSYRDGLLDLAKRAAPKDKPLGELVHRNSDSESPELLHVLVTNPPYIPSADVLMLEPDVRDYEPHLALDGGSDGLHFYRSIFAIGDGMFVPRARAAFFMEVGIGQAETLLLELNDGRYSGWKGWTFGVKRDFRNVPRVLYGKRIEQ
jgi:release factor glutamine methyltransferase